jgi:hypothetical protein
MYGRGERVLLGVASVEIVAGGALVGVGLNEASDTNQLWTNLWFDIGLPLMIVAIAFGVHASMTARFRRPPPVASGSDRPGGQHPGA